MSASTPRHWMTKHWRRSTWPIGNRSNRKPPPGSSRFCRKSNNARHLGNATGGATDGRQNGRSARLSEITFQRKQKKMQYLNTRRPKCSGASDGKKTEITKDVSAMANSAGGLIIYGIREFDDKAKRHLPEKIDPIDRTLFSREWLEQVINNIRPRIDKLRITPVPVDPNAHPNSVVYVVEIPRSITAHQDSDLRYYRRYNFQYLQCRIMKLEM